MTSNRLKEIASLKRKRHRDALSQTLVEGVRSVQSLMASDTKVMEVIVSSDFDNDRLSFLRANTVVDVVSPRDFAKISDVKNSQGIVAVAATTLVVATSIGKDEKILIFDGIADPGNAGAMIRTASWFGIGYVLAAGSSVDLFNPKVVRASMGGIWDVGLGEIDDLGSALSRMKTEGRYLAAADLNGTRLEDWQPPDSGALIIGSEAHGISAAVRTAVNDRVSIGRTSDKGVVESLNAAISCGIILSKWQQRSR